LEASFTTTQGVPRTIFRYAVPLSDDGSKLSHILGVLVLRAPDITTSALPSPARPAALQIDYV
jgi:hypothetical protein